MRFRSTRVRVRIRVKCRSVCFISTRVRVMSRTIVRGWFVDIYAMRLAVCIQFIKQRKFSKIRDD